MGARAGGEDRRVAAMSGAAGVVAFVVTLTGMVALHECGHLFTAKKFGMKVDAFFLGFGPRLFSWTRGETEYGVRAIPLGGYIKIAGMNPFLPVAPSDRDRVFGARPSWQRAVVLASGSATHFVLAAVILSVMFGVLGVPRLTTTIEEVSSKVGELPAPAKTAGLRPGDRIVAVDGRAVSSWEEVRRYIRARPGREIDVEIERGGEKLVIPAVPAPFDERVSAAGTRVVGRLGVLPKVISVRQPPHVAAASGIEGTGRLVALSVEGLGKIFSPGGIGRIFGSLGPPGERDAGDGEAIGIVGGARLAGQAASAGAVQELIYFLASFVVFVGVANLVPLPILDGGYLAVLGFEKVFRRRVDMRKLVPVGVLVLGFFIVLNVVLLYLDIARPLTNPLQ